MKPDRRRRGIASILAMLFIAMFAAMAVALATFSNNTLLKSENHMAIQAARFQAEGGLSFLVYKLKKIDLGQLAGDTLLDKVAAFYTEQLGASPAVQGVLQYAGGVLTIPATLTSGQEGWFEAVVTAPEADMVRLRVYGYCKGVSRSVSMDFAMSDGARAFFNYGIASRGPIRMTGNAEVVGVNDPSEAACLSATYGTPEAFNLTGNCDLAGGISISNPDGYATLTGNVTVGGERHSGTIDLETVQADPETYKAFKIGVGDVEFPEVNPGVFKPFATTEVTSSTNTSGNKTFTNIRIKANTNKTFSGNVTLKGVIFIEQPNRIHFSGNVAITGVIVTEDAGDDNYDVNTIKFSGNLTARGVEELPNTSEFQQLRDMPGSFILAPGFSTEFTGNFGTIGGTMAAERFKWAGNASGTVRGSIISYSDAEFKLLGNSSIRIDRSGTPEIPPGFTIELTFTPMPDSYVEY